MELNIMIPVNNAQQSDLTQRKRETAEKRRGEEGEEGREGRGGRGGGKETSSLYFWFCLLLALNYTFQNSPCKKERAESDKLKVSLMPTFIKLRG